MPTKEILEITASFLAGATISAVVTFQYTKSVMKRSNTVIQSNNKAGGNIVGGDSIQK